MKLNEQDSLYEKQQGNQRYLIRSSEKLKQIHKSKHSHSKQNHSNKISNKKSSTTSTSQNRQHYQPPHHPSISEWNTSSEQYSNQSSVIILTPSRKSHQCFKQKQLPFLTQENDQSSSMRDKNNNPHLMNSTYLSNNMPMRNIQKEQQNKPHCSIHSYQILSDEEKSCQEQIYASMVLITEKKNQKNQVENIDDYKLKNNYNYIDLLSSENKIIPHDSSSVEVEIESSVQEYYYKNNASLQYSKNVSRFESDNQKPLSQLQNNMPLQPLDTNIIQNIQTPKKLRNNDHQRNNEKRLCLSHTPFSSIKKRLFDTQHDFIGSQQENIDIMIREIQSASQKDNKSRKYQTKKSPSSSFTAHQNKHIEGENRQHIVKVLEVVKVKNSSAKLAKVSVFIENVAQLQIKYVHTLEIRQTHPELLIQYYEDTFDPYFLEIKEIF